MRFGKQLNKMLAPFGLRVSRRKPPLRSMRDVLTDLWQGKSEGVVIDVGAAAGNFTWEILRLVPGAHVVCIEPIPVHQAELKERFANYHVCIIESAVGDRNGAILFHQTSDQDCSSVLKANEKASEFPGLMDEVTTYTVPLNRLDTLLADEPEMSIDLLKIDTQGFEMEVLAGAESTLTRCANVLLEVSLRPLYEGQRPFEELVVFMYQHGFRMIDYVEGTRSRVTDELLQLDFLYKRVSE